MVDPGLFRLLMVSTSYSLVTLVLVSLRIVGAINWAWVWVLCPLWLAFALSGIAFASFILVKRMEQMTGPPAAHSLDVQLPLKAGQPDLMR